MANPKTLTTEETVKLLHTLRIDSNTKHQDKKCIRNHTIALLMLDAGLRVGEVVQLQSHHLYFNCQPVTSIIVSAEIAKNKTERIIPVSQRLSDALKKHAQANGAFDNLFYDKPVFFAGPEKNALTTRQVERIIRAAAEKSLGRPVHPHVLRHTFASNLMRVTDMRTVQELLGHQQMSSTQIYTHPNEDDKKKAITRMCEPTEEELAARHLPSRLPDTPNRPDTTGTHGDVG